MADDILSELRALGDQPAQAPKPQPPNVSSGAVGSDVLEELRGLTPDETATAAPQAQIPSESRESYLERYKDIPSDIGQEFVGGVSTLAGAPGKITGLSENQYADLVPKMMEMGAPREVAERMARKLQYREGLLDVITGPLQSLFSPIFGPIRSMVSRPVEETTGIPKEVTETGIGMLMGRPRFIKGPARTPISESLFDAADHGFTAGRALPIEYKPSFVSEMSDTIKGRLEQKGYYGDNVAKSTFTSLDRLKDPEYATPSRIDAVRQELGRLSREINPITGERTQAAGAASWAQEMLMDYMNEIKDTDVLHGAEHLPGVQREFSDARANYAAGLRSSIIENAIDRANRQAARSGKGTNIENSIRQQFDRIINNPKKFRMYNQAEQDMIRNVVEGKGAQNIERYAGMFSPSGIVSATGDVAISHLLGGKLGSAATLGIGGYFARKAAEAKARANAMAVAETTRKRSPLFREQTAEQPEQFTFATTPTLAALPGIENKAGFHKGGRVKRGFRLS